MDGLGTALDVAIGLVLMYVLLSLAVTAAVEYVASLFRLRARNLRQSLERLLAGSSAAARDARSLYALFRSSGHVASMSVASGDDPSYLESRVFARGISEALGGLEAAGGVGAGIGDAIETLPDGPIRRLLADYWRRAGGKVQDFEQMTADWFDSAMERAGGIFKRWTQWIALGAGVSIALAVNADTFAVARKLWQDDALRAQVSAMAQSVASDANYAEGKVALDELRTQMAVLPVGWGHSQTPADIWAWLVKVLGCAFTGMALAFGAPFWFDMLSKLVRLRSSGAKPATAAAKEDRIAAS